MDIVERLRIRADLKSPNDFVKHRRIETEAADYILWLMEERIRLKTALRDVLAKEYVADCKDVARAALKEGE